MAKRHVAFLGVWPFLGQKVESNSLKDPSMVNYGNGRISLSLF